MRFAAAIVAILAEVRRESAGSKFPTLSRWFSVPWHRIQVMCSESLEVLLKCLNSDDSDGSFSLLSKYA